MADASVDIAAAAAAVRRGELVGLPTETVYGLAGDATNPDAVAAIYAAKGRPSSNPLIIHVADTGGLERWGVDVPDTARKLADAFWPGPLTLVVAAADGLAAAVTAGLETVAIRWPAHPMATALINMAGVPLAAPSANRSGHISPTTAEHVVEALGDAIGPVLDGGPCAVGIESTIVDCTGDHLQVLRPGTITPEDLAAVAGQPVEGPASNAATPHPGSSPRHYAPETPLTLTEPDDVVSAVSAARAAGERVVVLAARELAPPPDDVIVLAMPSAEPEFARELYGSLRRADEAGADRIICELPGNRGIGAALRDRLRRAAHP